MSENEVAANSGANQNNERKIRLKIANGFVVVRPLTADRDLANVTRIALRPSASGTSLDDRMRVAAVRVALIDVFRKGVICAPPQVKVDGITLADRDWLDERLEYSEIYDIAQALLVDRQF